MILKHCIKQILRQPIISTLIVVLLSLSGIFILISIGIWSVAKKGVSDAKEQFTTIAVLNEIDFIQSDIGKERGVKKLPYSTLKSLYKAADESQYVEKIDKRRFCMAYSDNYNFVNSRKHERKINEYPYQYSIIVGTCVSVEYRRVGVRYEEHSSPGVVTKKAEFIAYTVTMKINKEESYMSDDDYPYEYVSFTSYQMMNDLRDAFSVGEKYIVYGHLSYPDAMAKPDVIPLFKMKNFYRDHIMLYGNRDFEWIEINEQVMKKLNIPPDTKIERKKITDMYILGFVDYKYLPYAKLDKTVDNLIVSETDGKWKSIINEWIVTMHSVQFNLTEDLESIKDFNQNTAYIIDGRSFCEEEYEEGTKVCIINSLFAERNGISVGDKVNMKFWFSGYKLYQGTTDVLWYPEQYDEEDGFFSFGEYTVVGIYTNQNEISADQTNYGANDIIAPNKSVSFSFDEKLPSFYQEQTDIDTNTTVEVEKEYISIPNSRSYILKPGTVQNFEEEMAAQGLGGYFYYFDQGYYNVGPIFEIMQKNSTGLLITSVLSGFIAIILCASILSSRNKDTISLMIKIGATKKHISVYIITLGLFFIIVYSLISITVATTIFDKVVDRVCKEAQEEYINTDYSNLRTVISPGEDELLVESFDRNETKKVMTRTNALNLCLQSSLTMLSVIIYRRKFGSSAYKLRGQVKIKYTT